MNSKNMIEKAMEKPHNYPICLNVQCALRECCLHAIETTEERLSASFITCVNPSVYEGTSACPEFRDKDAVSYIAFGMRSISEQLKHSGCYGAFITECLKFFCRTVYYEMLAGQHIITSQDQTIIRACAEKVGVSLSEDSFDMMLATKAW